MTLRGDSIKSIEEVDHVSGISSNRKIRKVLGQAVPTRWKQSSCYSETTLHQLSPYIGKLKSTIAADLIRKYSKKGDLIADPFCGSGTTLLEGLRLERHVFGSDVSPYAAILTKAKISAPRNLEIALANLSKRAAAVRKSKLPDLRSVPAWVREFFHPETLREAMAFAAACDRADDAFSMSCLLGILHHQRPGFLSYPSSHLVPYLRDKLFPPRKFPELYEYRPVLPRLIAKVERSYKRAEPFGSGLRRTFRHEAIADVRFPRKVGLIISSPPYMNALDYGRDNRLRLWLLTGMDSHQVDKHVGRNADLFCTAMNTFAMKAETSLKGGGHCVVIVGDKTNRSFSGRPSEVVLSSIRTLAPSLTLQSILNDTIPDIRRSRREMRGVRSERILIFRKKR